MTNWVLKERIEELEARIAELEEKLAGMTQMYEELYCHHFKEHHTPDYKRIEQLEQELAESRQSNKDFCETVTPQLSRLAELESRYSGAVEVDGLYIRAIDDDGYESTAIEVDWNPDVIGQRVKVLVYPMEEG